VSELLVLGCSATKRPAAEPLPAIARYDGPWYRDFRKHVRFNRWPANLDVAILSAEHGLIGALTPIYDYDRCMTPERAAELAPKLAPITAQWGARYQGIRLCLGEDYLPAFPERFVADHARVFKGTIGLKRQQLGTYLRSFEASDRFRYSDAEGRLSYFLPDWDDLLDPEFNFETDEFSGSKADRKEQHCALLMRPDKIADGILVSLAQARTAKGPLKYVGGIDSRTLRPLNLRQHYGLEPDQALFGDCGAFSYVNDEKPPISTENAVTLYDLYQFDFGASIDHIPVLQREVDGRSVILTEKERRARVKLTVENGVDFLIEAKKRASFVPVGTIQGLAPADYAATALLYTQLGYERIALGGLVPLTDDAIRQIVQSVTDALRGKTSAPRIHLFGVYRPKLQPLFRELGISSFDSATYFRKAWLRSGQNYLARSGDWYTAVRVPMTADGRTRQQLLKAGANIEELQALEKRALDALHAYGLHAVGLEETLTAIDAYDAHLPRSSEDASTIRAQYARTLHERPWEQCGCRICRSVGIDVLIFRGSNRNKRRGANNTAMLFQSISQRKER
jgi:hypothetical protein